MRVIVSLLFLVAVATACTVTPLPDNVIEVTGCDPVTVEPFNGTVQTGGPGQYQLPSTVGCNVVIVNDVVYSICGQQASLVACPLEPFTDESFAAKACALDAFLACAEDCCEESCCTEEEDVKVSTWVDHSWDTLVGSDGIAVVPEDSRVRAEGGFLIGTCSTPGGCDIGCLLGESLVASRDIFVPNCDPTTVTVKLVVESATDGATAVLGSGSPVDLVPGEVIVSGEPGLLVITCPLPTCSEGTPLNISTLEIDTHCSVPLNRTIECPPIGTYLVFVSPHEDSNKHRPSSRGSHDVMKFKNYHNVECE